MIRLGLALALAITLAGGCGLKGRLERPVPLWGNPPDEGALDPRNIKKAEEEKARKKAAEDAARTAPAAPATTTPAAPQ
jgi:predicted small lipoprotein YifL